MHHVQLNSTKQDKKMGPFIKQGTRGQASGSRNKVLRLSRQSSIPVLPTESTGDRLGDARERYPRDTSLQVAVLPAQNLWRDFVARSTEIQLPYEVIQESGI